MLDALYLLSGAVDKLRCCIESMSRARVGSGQVSQEFEYCEVEGFACNVD